MQEIIVLIGLVTLVFTIWVLYESKRARKAGESQIALSTEPIFKVHVESPNRDPIRIRCMNFGARVLDLEFSVGDYTQKPVPHYEQRFDDYFLELPKHLADGKEHVRFAISYFDRLKQRRSKYYIYDVPNRKISEA